MTFRRGKKNFVKSKLDGSLKILVSTEISTATFSKRWKMHDQVGLRSLNANCSPKLAALNDGIFLLKETLEITPHFLH